MRIEAREASSDLRAFSVDFRVVIFVRRNSRFKSRVSMSSVEVDEEDLVADGV